jgi:hypothetical protein
MIRILDPATATLASEAPVPLPTAYLGDRLLVSAAAADHPDPRVVEALAALGWELRVEPSRSRERFAAAARAAKQLGLELRSAPVAVAVLVPVGRGPASPPDAWTALQHIRQAAPDLAGAYQLDHVLAPTTLAGVGGYWNGIGGYWNGIGGYWNGIGGYWNGISTSPSEFGVPGRGGRSPVAVVAADPALAVRRLKRPPVVASPDSGVGKHPWFTAPAVTVHGSPNPDDGDGVSHPLTGDLDRLAGHGTFIAGIIRQTAPAARIASYPVLGSDGVVAEDVLLDCLTGLLARQVLALAGGAGEKVTDVLTLSLGYYHEDDSDTPTDLALATVLTDLGRAGVLVVAGAGNDAGDRPMLPAGFAGQVTGLAHDALPLVSVGSLNPNAATVSLFSNAGAWVTTYRQGAAIVSTLPCSEDAGAQPSVLARRGDPDDRPRATIDGDDYSGGFGVWSGTSFAAPVLAGQLARHLADHDPTDTTLPALLDRGWRAIEAVVGHPGVHRP